MYVLLNYLVRHRLINHVWVSRRYTLERRRLLDSCIDQKKTIFLTCWQLGYQLRSLNNAYVIDLKHINLQRLSAKGLHDLKWALHYARSVTKRTNEACIALVPSNFPVWKSYAVCVRDDLAVQCDFVKQTVKQLMKKDIHVVLVSTRSQPSMKNTLKGSYSYIQLVLLSTVQWLPYRLKMILKPFHRLWHMWKIRYFFAAHNTELIWCFDPEDSYLASLLGKEVTVLYDVIDYLSSVNAEVKSFLEQQHLQLLKKSDLVVANSHILHKHISKVRSDVKLVPQGFDVNSFQHTEKTKHSKIFSSFLNILEKRRGRNPVITYIGTLSFRIDYALLTGVIQSLPTYTFCLPKTILEWRSEDDAVPWEEKLKELELMPNIVWYPSIARYEVAALLKHTDIGIIPYDLAYTLNQYCFPMKFFEYLYAGVRILSTPITELTYYKDYVSLKYDTKSWVEDIREQGKRQKRVDTFVTRKLCLQHSWESKINTVCQYIQ